MGIVDTGIDTSRTLMPYLSPKRVAKPSLDPRATDINLCTMPQLYAVVQRFAGTPVYVEGVKRSEEKNDLWFTHNTSFSGILTAVD